MTSKTDANATDFPMDLNDMVKNPGEKNNNGSTIDRYATATDQIQITPGSPNNNSTFYRNSRSSTSHYISSICVTPDKGHHRNIANIFSTATMTVTPLPTYQINPKEGTEIHYEGS